MNDPQPVSRKTLMTAFLEPVAAVRQVLGWHRSSDESEPFDLAVKARPACESVLPGQRELRRVQ